MELQKTCLELLFMVCALSGAYLAFGEECAMALKDRRFSNHQYRARLEASEARTAKEAGLTSAEYESVVWIASEYERRRRSPSRSVGLGLLAVAVLTLLGRSLKRFP